MSSTSKVVVTKNAYGVIVVPEVLTVQVEESDVAVIVTAPGPQGIPGPPGVNSFYYLHTQSVPSTTWTINHALGAAPNVTAIINDAAVVCHADFPDLNTVILSFNTPTAGRAVCS